MRRIAAVVAAVLLTACGNGEQSAPEAAATAEAEPASLADFAGAWQYEVTLVGVEEPVPVTVTGSAEGDDWTMDLEGRPGIPLLVSVAGDSLISQSAEYESVLRPGVTASVRTASVLRDGGLVGNALVTYRTAAGEELVPGTVRGTRIR